MYLCIVFLGIVTCLNLGVVEASVLPNVENSKNMKYQQEFSGHESYGDYGFYDYHGSHDYDDSGEYHYGHGPTHKKKPDKVVPPPWGPPKTGVHASPPWGHQMAGVDTSTVKDRILSQTSNKGSTDVRKENNDKYSKTGQQDWGWYDWEKYHYPHHDYHDYDHHQHHHHNYHHHQHHDYHQYHTTKPISTTTETVYSETQNSTTDLEKGAALAAAEIATTTEEVIETTTEIITSTDGLYDVDHVTEQENFTAEIANQTLILIAEQEKPFISVTIQKEEAFSEKINASGILLHQQSNETVNYNNHKNWHSWYHGHQKHNDTEKENHKNDNKTHDHWNSWYHQPNDDHENHHGWYDWHYWHHRPNETVKKPQKNDHKNNHDWCHWHNKDWSPDHDFSGEPSSEEWKDDHGSEEFNSEEDSEFKIGNFGPYHDYKKTTTDNSKPGNDKEPFINPVTDAYTYFDYMRDLDIRYGVTEKQLINERLSTTKEEPSNTKLAQISDSSQIASCQPYNPIRPNFAAPGKRISVIQCDEYIWEIKARDEYESRSKQCFNEVTEGTVANLDESKSVFTGEFPHSSAIGWQTTFGSYVFHCGGILISAKYVLTAAHCGWVVDSTVTSLEPKIVRLGANSFVADSAEDYDPLDMNIQRFISHPIFDISKKYFDIALIQLERDVLFSPTLHPACLWTKPDTNEIAADIITGWGEFNLSNTLISSNVQKSIVEIVESSTCYERLQTWHNKDEFSGVQDHQICAGHLTDSTESCKGHGGVLQTKISLPFKSKESIYSIIGVASLGVPCAPPGVPAVYTRVASFIDWIEDIVWK